MFNKPNHAKQLGIKNFKGDPDKTLPDKRYIYKTKTTDLKPYLIYLEEFETNYIFVKFFPSRYSSSEKKYKIRLNERTLPNRLLATVVQVVREKMIELPNCTFGVYGQWDEIDVSRNSKSSQRYALWRKIAVSKFNSDNFHFVVNETYNVFLLIPRTTFSNEYIHLTERLFRERFQSKLEHLPVPTQEDFEKFYCR